MTMSIAGRVATAVASVLICVAPAAAQSTPRSEYEIKAAYLFTFGRFVDWPPRPARDESSFTICILGTDPFGPTLDSTLAGVTIHGQKVVARRLAAPEAAAGCHIVFVSASEERRAVSIVPLLKETGALTVSDMPQFVARGGMIQFVTLTNRVRFEINLQSAREAGLTMSSELLRVASAVRNGAGPAE
jgi:hypothetical protein